MDQWMIAAVSGVLASLILFATGFALLLPRLRNSHRERGNALAQPTAQGAAKDSDRRREVAHLARVSMLGELSGAIAHELNQPLTAILSNAQAAQRMLKSDHADPCEVYDILGDIIAEDKRAVQIIQRLRALLTKNDTDVQLVDMAELVEGVIALSSGTLVASDVAVTAHHSRGIPPVLVDNVQIQQVLLNLILNASDAMSGAAEGQPRQLGITATLAADGSVLIAVSDNGPGIAADVIDNVFDPFYSTKRKGLGLGLAISKTIVDAHGGRIWAVNNPDVGATFCFTLPAANVEQSTLPPRA